MFQFLFKRLFDIFFSTILILILILPFVFISFLILITTYESPIYFSKRIGKNKQKFLMPKFRTMKKDTPQIATHLLKNSDLYLSKIGIFLRKTSIDEIPQLYTIFTGKMSFVGPRPALYNQYDLISKRDYYKINDYIPGVTGFAQINGRDELSIDSKVELDLFYIHNISFLFDLKIILLTIIKVFKSENISH